ncbi:MAG: aldehyde ferredoxin oxidoreductase family protein [Sedimentibacter saalensis]|uniref:aldehyde ferredoxin oxidoreductase family protein n=1 Tax=Sedimentibacter saalensis TaxID=130788 RepID=UPI003157F73E
MKGYKNCIIKVDLSNGNIKKEHLNADYIKRYLGGEGYGIALLWNHMPLDAHPLSPENLLSFNTGPMTGTPAPSASRTSVCFMSPLTNTIGASNMGSHFGAELKFAGYDTVAFTGKAEKPVYLLIDNENVEIKDASSLWGMDTRETTEKIKEAEGQDIKVCCIGQSGEKLSKLACIFSDDCFAGRGGAGAVMGSKNLKAVAVRGTGKVEIADTDAFKRAFRNSIRELREEAYTWGPVHGYGTPAWVGGADDFGILPTRNFIDNKFEEIEKVLPYNLWNNTDKYKVTRRTCYACQLGCHKYVVMGDVEVGEMEYESLAAFGPRCGVSDYESICMAGYYTTIYGIDSISGGSTISAIMEWYEKGIITKEQTDGLEMNFGNGPAMAEMLRKMCLREGCGDLYADGSFAAAKKIGGKAMDYVMAVKGMEISATDPRGSSSMTVAFGTSERGACHMRPYAATIDAFGYLYPDLDINEPKNPFSDTEDKTWLKALKECFVVTNLAGICDFNVINAEMKPSTMAELYTAITGVEIDKYELLRTAERTIALERAINYIRGFRRKDDRLPKRFMTEPATGGPPQGRVADMEAALDKYYEACSYDKETAIPTLEKYQELGMMHIAEKVYNLIKQEA